MNRGRRLRRGRAIAVLLAAACAACDGSSQRVSAGLGSPSALVQFRGITAESPAVKTYVAVAAARGAELRILDPSDDRPVLGPTNVFPLSIPTDDRPLKLAAASLGDDSGDLLVVASPSTALSATTTGPAVQLVVTWHPQGRIRVAGEIPISGLGIDAATEILSLLAVTTGNAAAPRARLFASLSGGKLAVLDFTRGGENAVVAAGTAAVRDLVAPAGPFEAVDLAVAPDGTRLFAATPDPLGAAVEGAVYGVAQLEMTGDPSAWPLTVIDARSPTRHVAAATVVERALASPAQFAGEPAVLRVYAALDPEGPDGCGPTRRIGCGVATLDPITGQLAPDPVEAGSYRKPAPIGGVPADLVTSPGPARVPPTSICSGDAGQGGAAPIRLAPRPGARCTSGLAAVPSSDGNTYVLDLGRWQVPSEQSVIGDATTRARVRSAASTPPAAPATQPPEQVQPVLGLAPLAGGAPSTDPTEMLGRVQVTPGFIDTDTWSVTWQGALPGLRDRRGVVLRLADGRLAVAAQVPTGVADVWITGARVASRELGAAPGDIVQLRPDDAAVCGAAAVETSVTEVIAAAAPSLPGGGLGIAEGCWSTGLAAGGSRAVTFTVRASGLVVTSTALGYAGRAAFDTPYRLEYLPAEDPAHLSAPQTELQLLSRKARRRFYPAEHPRCDGECPGYPGVVDPLAPGPVIRFTVGKALGNAALDPPRDARIDLATESGYVPMTRRPSGGAVPQGAIAVDRSPLNPDVDIDIRYYVAYLDDQVFVFGPGEAGSAGTAIR